MRIREVIVEAGPAAYEKGKSAMNTLLSPTKWFAGTKAQKSFDQGSDAMNKLLSPSRYLEPGNTEPTKEKNDKDTVDNPKALAKILDQIISGGKPLDTAVLRQLHDKYKPQIADSSVTAAIDRLYRGGQLDSQNLFDLKQYRNTL